jgi:hypothetical protein
MFNILAIKGNINQNNIDASSHPSQYGHHQEIKQQMLVRLQGKGTIYTIGWQECKLVQPLCK